MAPQLQAVPNPAPATGPQPRRLKKGELLFAEGENSRAMYFLKSGVIRLFKKKGDQQIELDTVRAGQVLGELAFLDGNPRSASGEALMDCELVEVSGPTFQQVLVQMPDWLKILLKTVVGRLRNASTRIRQLESASTSFDYSDKSGKANYVYLSATDTLKILSGILLVAARYGTDLRLGLVNRFVNQIMGVPSAKIETMIDILTTVGIADTKEEALGQKVTLKDLDFLEKLIAYLNDENLCERAKRHDVTPRAFAVMNLIVKYLGTFPKDEKTGLTTINLAAIRAAEATPEKPDSFRIDDFLLLVKLGYASNINMKSAEEMLSFLNAEDFILACRFQSVAVAVQATNEQKRASGAGAK